MSDIDVLINYVSSLTVLKQQGSRHYGICPIPNHQEKTGSFIIDEKSGRWKCYGCQASGSNAIYLYMEVNGCEWREAKKALGLWDNARPTPRARAPSLPRHFESDDKRECYRMARSTLVAMHDCEIEYQGKKYWNNKFILKCLESHTDRDKYIEKICVDIAEHSERGDIAEQAKRDPWLFIILFVNDAYQ